MAAITQQLAANKERLLQSLRLDLLARVVPDRILHKTVDLAPDNFTRVDVAAARELVPAETIALTDPEQLEFLQRQLAVPDDNGRFRTENVMVWVLEDPQLDPSTGAVVAADGSLIIDSIKNDGRLRRVRAFGRAMPQGKRIAGTFSTISGTHIGNHFHWLIDALPRLHSLEQFGEPVTLVMPETLTALRRDTLAMCLPDNVTAAYMPAEEWLWTERFILPSYLTRQWDFAYLPPDHLQATRNRILAAYGLTPDHVGQRRLYISRAKAAVRRVLNEDETESLLTSRGFEVVYLEDLPFADQVRTLHDAAMVVAPHGAGLANLLFAGRIPVIELATPVATPVYFFLALALGQHYRYVLPVEMPGDSEVISMADSRRYSAVRDRDIVVPVVELLRILDQLS